MKVVAFLFASASSQRVWTVEQDSVITRVAYVAAAAQNCFLSSDPSITAAGFRAPAADSVDRSLMITCAGQEQVDTSVPVSAGENILVAISGVGTVVVTLEELS